MSSFPVYDISKYGGKGDGHTDNVKFLLAAVADIFKANRKAILLIPSGSFVCSAFKIANVHNLVLQIDGTLQAPSTTGACHWSGESIEGLYTFENCPALNITGKGTVDGNGENWWKLGESVPRPPLFLLRECVGIAIQGMRFRNAPFYHFRILNCSKVVIRDNVVTAPADSPNTDGFNLQDTSSVQISNNSISNGDDAIAINSFVNPSTDYIVDGNKVTNGHGISIGSATYNLISDVKISNNTITGTKFGLRIKSHVAPKISKTSVKKQKTFSTGGKVRRISFENNTLGAIAEVPIMLTSYYQVNDPNDTTTYDQIVFSSITCSSSGKGPVFEVVSSAQILSPIVLDNVHLSNVGDKAQIKNVTFVRKGTVVGVEE